MPEPEPEKRYAGNVAHAQRIQSNGPALEDFERHLRSERLLARRLLKMLSRACNFLGNRDCPDQISHAAPILWATGPRAVSKFPQPRISAFGTLRIKRK